MAAKKTPSLPAGKDVDPGPSFESAIQRLANIVEELEGGELPLEQSLALFEEGIVLARSSQRSLDAAEKRVEQLLAIDGDGNPVVDELDADA